MRDGAGPDDPRPEDRRRARWITVEFTILLCLIVFGLVKWFFDFW